MTETMKEAANLAFDAAKRATDKGYRSNVIVCDEFITISVFKDTGADFFAYYDFLRDSPDYSLSQFIEKLDNYINN